MDYKKIAEAIEPFGMKVFNQTIQFLAHCQKNGITYGDLREYQGYVAKNMERINPKPMRINRDCPQCGGPVALRAIRIPKGKANKYGYKSHWFCLAKECNWESYTTQNHKNLFQKYGVVEWQMD